ncbi:unnamed protein product [Tuber aestivum]|uniref:Ribosomal protein s17 n=1 Tax=Tuber aestivum TaxID=59557 RepID=A0A292PVA6_9PEZI|nr:unnamed protein product [Tuber aestivum]
MIVPTFSVVLLASAGLASAISPYQVHARGLDLVPRQNNNGGNNRGGNNAGNNNNNTGNNNQNNNDQANDQNDQAGDNQNNALLLDPANVQEASQATGQEDGAEAGQADSATDDANFINFCTGKTLTNGLQVQGGSCNGIVMGDIPSTANMVSSIIINPQPGQDLAADTAFTVQVQVENLAAGSFTNPANTYYAAPQALNGGIIVGHTHVTVQDLGGSLTPDAAPNADTFTFFKGINDAGNGNGLLEAEVTDGLPAGFYRICTMASASNHQPVIMPIAQRGAQDDCTKFTVGQGNAGADNNNQFYSILTYFGINRATKQAKVNRTVKEVKVNRVVKEVKVSRVVKEAKVNRVVGVAVTVAAPSRHKPPNPSPLSYASLYL